RLHQLVGAIDDRPPALECLGKAQLAEVFLELGYRGLQLRLELETNRAGGGPLRKGAARAPDQGQHARGEVAETVGEIAVDAVGDAFGGKVTVLAEGDFAQ